MRERAGGSRALGLRPMSDLDTIRLAFDPSSLKVLTVVLGFVMFGVALDLRLADFAAVAKSPKGPLVGMLCQFIVLPAASFLLVLLLRPPPSIALGMILVAACPGGNMSNFLTHLAGGHTVLSVCMTAVSSVAALVMTPLNVSFWGALTPGTAALLHDLALDPWEMLGSVALMLGVPLVLGMLAAAHLPRLAAKLRRPLKWLSILFFVSFLVLALRANAQHFAAALPHVFLPVLLQNAAGLTLGYWIARLFRLPEASARAVSIEVGIQNSGLGLVLVFSFFGGLGGMAVVAAWWGVWHIVSGFALASFWSRRSANA